MHIVCPSTMAGEIRALKVSDLDILTDRRLVRQYGGQLEGHLAKRVWSGTTDLGPYVFDGDPPWLTDVLIGDRFYVVVQSRIMSRGDDYDFECRCENQACQHAFTWGIKLSDLPVRTLKPEAIERFRDGNRFASELPDIGKVVGWGLPTGKIQKRIDGYSRQYGKGISVAYAARLTDVPGCESPSGFVDFVKELSVRDFETLVDDMEENDCGVDTEIEVVCPECDTQQAVDVPLGGAFFGVTPGKSRRRLARQT